MGLVSQRPEIFIGGSHMVVFIVGITKVPNEEADLCNVSVTEFHRRKHERRVDIFINNEKLLNSAESPKPHTTK